MADYYVATTGNDTTGDGSAGNPYATPGKASGVATGTGDIIWLKSGTYSVTSTTANVTSGRVSLSARVMLRGYQTTIGDDAARPVIQASGIASTTLVTASGTASGIWNVEADGNSFTGIRGVDTGFNCFVFKCTARNCKNSGISCGNTGVLIVSCFATGCSTAGGGFIGVGAGAFFACESTANSVPGFALGGQATATGCLSYANTGSSSHGFSEVRVSGCFNCVAYGNGGSGFQDSFDIDRVRLVNCISYGNSRYGTELAVSTNSKFGFNVSCAFGANSLGNHSASPYADISAVTLSANPFANAASGNFALNTTAGGGAACRAAGIPGAFPGGTTAGYPDIGAVQHQDSGSVPNRGIRTGGIL